MILLMKSIHPAACGRVSRQLAGKQAPPGDANCVRAASLVSAHGRQRSDVLGTRAAAAADQSRARVDPVARMLREV